MVMLSALMLSAGFFVRFDGVCFVLVFLFVCFLLYGGFFNHRTEIS